MKRFLLALLILCSMAIDANAAILVRSPNGTQTTTQLTLAAAATAATAAGTTVVVTSAYTLTSNLSWPADRQLEIAKGGLLTLNTGVVLSFASQPTIGLYQVFAGPGVVSGLKEARPQWWGTGSYALQQAANQNSTLRLAKDTYTITSTVTIPKYTSVVGEAGANIVANFTTSSTWASDFVALRFTGLLDVDVTPNDYNVVFKDVVITSIAANTVQAIAVQVPHGATSSIITESRTYNHWSNIMVVGFDTAYDLGQITDSDLTALKARDIRVGINFVGKNVNVFLTNLDLYKGAPQTTSVATSVGILVNSYFRGGTLEERPESFSLTNSLVAAFYKNIDIERVLLFNVHGNVIDLGTGGPGITVGVQNGGNFITNNYIAAPLSYGILCADTSAADILLGTSELLIAHNSIISALNGVYMMGGHKVKIHNNAFEGGTSTDIVVNSSKDVAVIGNTSISNTATMVNVTSSYDTTVDDNTTQANIPVYTHPTANFTGITIKDNRGAVQRTYLTGKAIITSGLSTINITVPMGSNSYVYPVVKIFGINSTTANIIITPTLSVYGTDSSTIAITSSVAAPAGGITFRYEVVGYAYIDA